jgi:hypothetical protein
VLLVLLREGTQLWCIEGVRRGPVLLCLLVDRWLLQVLRLQVVNPVVVVVLLLVIVPVTLKRVCLEDMSWLRWHIRWVTGDLVGGMVVLKDLELDSMHWRLGSIRGVQDDGWERRINAWLLRVVLLHNDGYYTRNRSRLCS